MLRFFFQAEDGIRDLIVTGVQTCALPIFKFNRSRARCVIWRGRLLSEGLLLVVELDVGLIQQGDVEAEREVAVRGLEKREARVPAVQGALEANGVGPELPGVEVVVRGPGRRPMRGRLE